MAENSKIEWTDHTFNPWEGCTKVSPGCAHCYAEARNRRFHGNNWGKGALRRRTSEANWKQPLKWNERPLICNLCGDSFCLEHGITHRHGTIIPSMHRARVFCASLADWLDDELPIEWLADLLKLIHDTPNLDWLLLTKRPENFEGRYRKMRDEMLRYDFPRPANICAAVAMLEFWRSGEFPTNVWIGTSVEDQPRADERIPELLRIPAAVRFLSVEPMLSRIDLWQTYPFLANGPKIHWAIFGGESGPGARQCNIEWIRDGVKQCRAAGVAPFVKQLGANVFRGGFCRDCADENGTCPSDGLPCGGFKDKKGGDMSEWPEDLQNVREFPTT